MFRVGSDTKFALVIFVNVDASEFIKKHGLKLEEFDLKRVIDFERIVQVSCSELIGLLNFEFWCRASRYRIWKLMRGMSKRSTSHSWVLC